ncbi:glycosyltransferase [Gramella sp. AN32]|uniref:Glycosyltransferase n=1 Tax=Christiangramia antarctica TaxID=2058158 RepID=A0ABW5X7D2_9FLAO|nr:glycosyltransferase [Gramella sp. AN32]
MIYFLIGFYRLKEVSFENRNSKFGFSIVIPFRNEGKNLKDLFESLKFLNYPKELFEIILINDFSEDDSLKITEGFKNEETEISIRILENLKLSKFPKKDAIALGIKSARFTHICTTDADCILPENWLHGFNKLLIKADFDLIAGPVGFKRIENSKWFQQLEELDFLSLQAVTIGAFGINRQFMCNAANLCFKKSSYLRVQEEIQKVDSVSGDDIFLLQEFKKRGFLTGFSKNKDQIVRTNYQQSFAELIQQRIRWGKKGKLYQGAFSKLVGVVVLSLNIVLILFLILSIFGFFNWKSLCFVFFGKFLLDFFMIQGAAKFFMRERMMNSFLWAAFVHPFFISWIVIASLFSKVKWKGRSFKQ